MMEKTSPTFSTATGLGNDEVWNMMEDKEGNIWFSSEGYGVYKYNGNSFENFGEEEGLKVKAVQTIYQDKFGQIWAGGGGGLFKLDGKKFIEVKRNDDWYGC
jgi:ligand-binding sensor domain-containing protein